MDLLSKTNGFHDVQKEAGNTLRATNATSVFKSTGRDTGANWANRINKDVNDLVYDVSFSQFRGKDDSPHQFRMKSKLAKKNWPSKKDEKQFDKHVFRLELMKMNKVSNPQKLNIIQKEKYSTLDTQGLCKFQFDKTIAGRLKHREHKHLDFNNQTTRQMFLNDNFEQNGPTQSQEKRDNSFRKKLFSLERSPKNSKLHKYHDFESYSPRRVFEPREQLDKFYNTDNYFKSIRANRTKETAKMEGLTGRIQPRPRESSTLSYEEIPCKNFVMRTPKSHQLSRSPRNIEFRRQVISPQRGCFR